MIDIKLKVKAMNEFIFYDLEKKNTYRVLRLGNKFGLINENCPYYHRWIVLENPNTPTTRTLKTAGFFVSNYALESNNIIMDNHYNELSFNSLDEAINQLFTVFPDLTA